MALHDLEKEKKRATIVNHIINILMDAEREGYDPRGIVDEAMILFTSPTKDWDPIE
ncbi:hypothetical protein HNR48_001587 [Pseudoteredinibacter isoporae]|uniref:Uncharacterized protein n=1 Tax=Pseudoteredinibacter isoporae TaxID=570281 RepID=A0A7X0JT02_9GAMM|nr:hypothetical protein [Pseudoteredinibacter isoporae]